MSRASRFFLVTALPLLLACLAACSAKQSGDSVLSDGPAPVGNMQKNVPSGNFVSADGKILFTDTDKATGEIQLLSYDPETRSATPFCKDATCSHSDESVCAAGGIDSNLESCNGEIYGASLHNIMKLDSGRFEKLIEGSVSHFFHWGDNLYVATMDSSLVVFKGSSKKPRTLIEEYTGYWESICNGYLYYQFGGVYRLNLAEEGAEPEMLVENAAHITDGRHIYYAKDGDAKLYRCGMDGSDPEQLTDRPVLVASWNFDDEYFYYRYYTGDDMTAGDSHDIYRLSKENPSQVEKIIELPVPAYQIFTDADSDILFIKTLGEEGEIYIFSKADQTVERIAYGTYCREDNEGIQEDQSPG